MTTARRWKLAATAALLAATSLCPQARADYTFYTVDYTNAAGTTINGISNAGQLVGFGVDAAGNVTNFTDAFTVSGGKLTNNFTTVPLTGAAPMANGLNAGGTVVGTDGANAIMFAGGTQTPLPQPNPGNTAGSVAFGINDGGTIVGQYTDTGTGTTPGFVDAKGKFTILNPVAPVGGVLVVNAQGINTNGLVTGFYSTSATPVGDGNTLQHGFFYDTTTAKFTFPADPNVPNFATVQFLGLNDTGTAVGYYQDTAGNQHGFLYNIASGSYTFLDPTSLGIGSNPFIVQITGINNADTITGFYIDPNGTTHGFVGIKAVPEPASMALLGLGAIVVVARRRRGARRA